MFEVYFVDTNFVRPDGSAFGAGERNVDQTLVLQQLTKHSQQVALMIVPP